MIARIWYGWTTLEKADSYYHVLTTQVIPEIEEMDIKGFRKIEVLRRNQETEVEFITIMYFDSIENIKKFTGEDYETAHVPEEAQMFLKRWDLKSLHYEVLDSIYP